MKPFLFLRIHFSIVCHATIVRTYICYFYRIHILSICCCDCSRGDLIVVLITSTIINGL